MTAEPAWHADERHPPGPPMTLGDMRAIKVMTGPHT